MISPIVLASYVIVWTADPTPSPVPEYTGNEDLVTPGIVGFVITFLIAATTVLLLIDMTRRVRRVRYRAEVREQLEAEAAAAAVASSGPAAKKAAAKKAAKPGPDDSAG